MKKTIRDYNLHGKKVIIRVDFNVPIKGNIITDDTRIKESLPTINFAIKQGAKIILLSHLGRIKEDNDKKKYSLKIVADKLGEFLNQKVIFINETRGQKLQKAVNDLKNGQVLLIENTRFEDLNGNLESGNDEELGKTWASLGEIFINDAFGTCHRAHASNVGIASYLPNGIGFLVEKELTIMEKTIQNPEKPFAVILGGSKVKDKIGVINNLTEKADYLLIGGAMCFTFLKAQGFEIGRSLLDKDSLDYCLDITTKYPNKIILPVDVICAEDMKSPANVRLINEIKENEMGLDIGPKTIILFEKYINKSNTIIWNGPLGLFEDEKFKTGTKEIARTLANHPGMTIAGGGDTASAIKNMGYTDGFNHISTGGGASLELLEGKVLKGVEIIDEK
ncbi:MAG: phosphoglycerate kinase [Bacilli bacterium]|nr:phosphoglycerate kinase [Bacilli bacterium]